MNILAPNPVYGCVLASWSAGLFVHPDITLQGLNASTYETIPADEYEVHPASGMVIRKPFDDDASPNAVDWSIYSAYRATYYLYNPSTNSATAHPTNEAQTMTELDVGIAASLPVTGRLNESTAARGTFLVGDYLSLGTVGTRPVDANTGTGIWGDKTGIYGLASNVQQAVFSASTGKITAGAGTVTLDSNGITIAVGTGDVNRIKWTDSANNWTGTYFYGLSDATDSRIQWVTQSKTTTGHSSILWGVHNNSDLGVNLYASADGTSGEIFFGVRAPTGVRISSATGNASEVETVPSALLHLYQAGRDDGIIALESSDVAHGITDLVATTIYGHILKAGANDGGVQISGYTESTIGVRLAGRHTTDDTNKATTAVAPVLFTAQLKSGTGVTDVGANANIAAFRNNATTRAIIDGEGDLHLDATSNANAWDEHDDLALIETYRVLTANPNFKLQFAKDIQQHAQILAETGVITLNEDGHHFVSLKGLLGLMIDATRQIGGRMDKLECALIG